MLVSKSDNHSQKQDEDKNSDAPKMNYPNKYDDDKQSEKEFDFKITDNVNMDTEEIHEYKAEKKVIVVNGPGSFTGIRVGIATIKALSDSKNLPVVEVNSLEALAYSALILDIQGLTQGISDEHEGQHQQHNCYTWEDGQIGCIQNDESVILFNHAAPRGHGRLHTDAQETQARFKQDGRSEIGR